MDFNIDDYPYNSDVVMHCSTEEEAECFLCFLDSIGMSWSDGSSLSKETLFQDHGSESCYSFTNKRSGRSHREVRYGDRSFYESMGYTILEAHNFNFEEDADSPPEELFEFLRSLTSD